MKITRLNLTNYRGVHSLSLDFQERLIVFFGVNGAGKSTMQCSCQDQLKKGVPRHCVSAIEPFLEESLSENEMRQFVSGYLQKDRNGMYGEFWMTIVYVFGGYATA